MCIKYTIYNILYIYIDTYMLIYIYMFAATSLMFSFSWMDTMATYESWSCKAEYAPIALLSWKRNSTRKNL